MNEFSECGVLIVDDEREIADLLCAVLRHEGIGKVYAARDAAEGLALFVERRPDLVLLDIMLPDGDGYELFAKMQAVRRTPILFVSAKDEEVDRLLGFALGAEDYVTKPFSAKEVAFRVKARLRGRAPGAPEADPRGPGSRLFAFGDLSVDLDAGELRKGGELRELTAKEFKMLRYFIGHPKRVLSKEMIGEAVWGDTPFGADNTIAVHIRKLRTKIEDDPSKPRFIRTVIGLGYKFLPDGS